MKYVYFLGGLFGVMFLLQIWVAQAENDRIKNASAKALEADLKIVRDNNLRKQVGLSERAEKGQRTVAQKESKKTIVEEFVWYKPWTWFK